MSKVPVYRSSLVFYRVVVMQLVSSITFHMTVSKLQRHL